MQLVHASLAAALSAAAPVLGSPPLEKPSEPTASWKTSDMDRNCSACSDFYQFANGGWLDGATIPTGQSTYSTYREVGDVVDRRLKSIIDEGMIAAQRGDNSTVAKIGLFWTSCMDEAAAERDGASPLGEDFAKIDAIRSRTDLMAEVRRLNLVLPSFLFWTDVGPDPKNPGHMMIRLSQGGLSLPEVQMYLTDDVEAKAARQALRTAIERMFEASGQTREEARGGADAVIALETQLARSSRTPQGLRDLAENFHPMTVTAANRITPGWEWSEYLSAVGVGRPGPIDIGQPEFFSAMAGLLASRPIQEWQAYMRWQLLRRASPWLSKSFRDVRRDFSATFSGAKGEAPRAKQCLEAVNYALGWGLGDIYRQRYFGGEAARRGKRMVANLKWAMAVRIRSAQWMSSGTRKKALAKLHAARIYLGGPSTIPDYRSFDVVRGPFWANMSGGYEFVTRTATGKAGKPTDRAEWYQLPQTASGAADFERNQFQYPAAKFTPPFFDPAVDDALNYGALGATLGHELTHLFDDRGRKYDRNGRMNDWWTGRDSAAYDRRAKRLIAAYDGYAIGAEKLDGKLTSSENIADQGGLAIAYLALQRELKGKPRRKIDGFSQEQRFFLAWARNFRELSSPQQLRRQIRSDEHAPSKARVNLPLSNMEEFHHAFGCRPSDPMYRPRSKQARVW